MAIRAQIVSLYCLKFGLNAAIHTITFIGTSDSYKRQLIFLRDLSHGVRGKIKTSLTNVNYLHAK